MDDTTPATVTTTNPAVEGENNLTTKSLEEIKAEARAFAYSAKTNGTGQAVAVPTTENNNDMASDENNNNNDIQLDDDDYTRFVKSLRWNQLDRVHDLLLDDDEDEFQWNEKENEDDSDDDDDDNEEADMTTQEEDQDNERKEPAKISEENYSDETNPIESKPDGSSLTDRMYHELQEELGWLVDEEMEALETVAARGGGDAAAAVAMSLTPERKTEPQSDSATPQNTLKSHPLFLQSATQEQQALLKSLLKQHFQLLFQLSVQSVRAAKIQPTSKVEPESAVPTGFALCNHIDIVDQAVGMLQDLKQHRQDAIRKCIAPQRQLFTRSQFRQVDTKKVQTAFDIPGLANLNETFAFFDQSVAGVEKKNILTVKSNAEACRFLFKSCGVEVCEDLLPGSRELSANFSDAKEIFGPDFKPPCTTTQANVLQKNLNLFTAAEDNLILRGVNSFGEKKWGQVSLHFLPERSSPNISQRYSKLTMFIFKAQGVLIHDDGTLPPIPKYNHLDDVDHDALNKLKKVPCPANLEVHRWSVEEDVALLKGVQVLGSMWAEIRALLIPHRDRGHLRKRYQMLERRIKNCINRSNRHDKALMRRLVNAGAYGSDDASKARGSLSMTAMSMARRTNTTASHASSVQNSASVVGSPSATTNSPQHPPPNPMYPPPPPSQPGYYAYPPPPHYHQPPPHQPPPSQPLPHQPQPSQPPPNQPPPPQPYAPVPYPHPQPPSSPQQPQSTHSPPYQPPMYNPPPPYAAHPGQPQPPPPYHYPYHAAAPVPYYYGGPPGPHAPPPPYGVPYHPPHPYYAAPPPSLPVASGAPGAAAQQPLSPAPTHRATSETGTPGHQRQQIYENTAMATEASSEVNEGDNDEAPDASRMAVENLLLMSAKKTEAKAKTTGGASKRGRKNSLFNGVMNRLGAQEGDEKDGEATNANISLLTRHDALYKSTVGEPTKPETTEEEDERIRSLTPPVYFPDEQLTASSIGTFHNVANSPFLGTMDAEEPRPMTRTALFGTSSSIVDNADDMEAASALKSLGSPAKTRGTKRKSLFASVMEQSEE